jgi:GH25 family lysozyme M1 (1,4-beta-N-acetylmuramidase)
VRWRWLPYLLLLLLPLLVAACGESSHEKEQKAKTQARATIAKNAHLLAPPRPTATMLAVGCAEPAQPLKLYMGACVAVKYGKPAETKETVQVGSFGAKGLDVSVYQGLPEWSTAHGHGVQFVWNQSSDGFGPDWNFVANWVSERRFGIVPGAYIFLRPGAGYSEGRYLGQRILAARRSSGGNELPPLIDSEVNGAYEQTSSAERGVKSVLGNVTVATYTSPGLWGGCCRGGTELDAAIWGTGGYAFGGWPTYVAQQYCGTCSFPGVGGEVDLQVDHGVLEHVVPPKPRCRRCELEAKRKQLFALYAERVHIRSAINRVRVTLRTHHCLVKHPRKACRELAAHGRELHRRGDSVNARIQQLHREGV